MSEQLPLFAMGMNISEAIGIMKSSWNYYPSLEPSSTPVPLQTITTDNTNDFGGFTPPQRPAVPQPLDYTPPRLEDWGGLGKIVFKEQIPEFFPSWTMNMLGLTLLPDEEDDGLLIHPDEMTVLEDVEKLYGQKKIMTNREKIETALHILWETRKISYDPDLTENDVILFERIDRAIDYLLGLARAFDKLQQKVWARDEVALLLDVPKNLLQP